MEWIREGVTELSWRGDVVSKSTDWDTLTTHLELLPVTEQVDEEVASELLGEHLGQEEEVGDQGTLKDDWDVRGVEQLDLISWWLGTLHSLVLDINVYLEALEVDDYQEDKDRGEHVVQVWKPGSLESVLQGVDFVWCFHQRVEEINNSTFIFIALSTPHGDWGEALPQEGLTDVRSNEQGDSTSDSIALLEHFIEHNDDNTGKGQL